MYLGLFSIHRDFRYKGATEGGRRRVAVLRHHLDMFLNSNMGI